jgi:Pregnancy-associated plasma protein-A
MAVPTKRVCAAMENHNHLVAVDEMYRANRRALESFAATARLKKRTKVIHIPVVVHVLFHADAENLSQEQIESQIAALNRDYRNGNPASNIPAPFRALAADPLVEFALAVRDPQGRKTTGITRKFTSKTVFPYDQFDPQATAKLDSLIKFDEFGRAAWPRDDYLNLWTCSLGGSLLGYAQFPGGPAATDGVVILSDAFGSVGTAAVPGNVFNLGRTAVHEVGHWLNLLHIWGDDNGGCTGSDNVADTPNQAGSNPGKPTFPHVTCNNAPNGDMFMNYMDYVDDDTMFMFTTGQVDRMNTTLAGARASLAKSKGLKPVGSERVRLPRARRTAKVAAPKEAGDQPSRWFDGVSWVARK